MTTATATNTTKANTNDIIELTVDGGDFIPYKAGSTFKVRHADKNEDYVIAEDAEGQNWTVSTRNYKRLRPDSRLFPAKLVIKHQ